MSISPLVCACVCVLDNTYDAYPHTHIHAHTWARARYVVQRVCTIHTAILEWNMYEIRISPFVWMWKLQSTINAHVSFFFFFAKRKWRPLLLFVLQWNNFCRNFCVLRCYQQIEIEPNMLNNSVKIVILYNLVWIFWICAFDLKLMTIKCVIQIWGKRSKKQKATPQRVFSYTGHTAYTHTKKRKKKRFYFLFVNRKRMPCNNICSRQQ